MSDPSPIEVRQAALLAHGLSVGAGHDWHKVDPDVREALFALRPELAPPPRSGLLEEALAEVLDGPLAVLPSEEERHAAAELAAALAAEGPALPADTQDAVYALSPERAPAPQLSIDDILDSVATGPFAPVIRITGEFPAEIAPPTNLRAADSDTPESPPSESTGGEVVPLSAGRAARPVPVPQPASRKWWLPAMGALAAAAATVLFVVPGVSLHEAAPTPGLSQAPEPMAAPASPSADADDRSVARSAPKKKRSQASTTSTEGNASAGSAGPAQKPASPKGSGGTAKEQGAEAELADRGPRPTDEAQYAWGDAEKADDPGTMLDALGYLDTTTADGTSAKDASNSGFGGMVANTGDYGPADDAVQNQTAPEPEPISPAEAVEPSVDAPPPTGAERTRDSRREDADAAGAPAGGADEDDFDVPAPVAGGAGSGASATRGYAEEELAEEEAKLAKREDVADTYESAITLESRARPRRSGRRASTAPSAAPAPAPPAEASAAQEAPNTEALGLIEPELASRHPGLVDVWTRAYTLELRGDLIGAAQTLSRLAAGSADADVIVDAAVRAGRLWLRVGNDELAMSAADRAASVSPSSYRLKAARADLLRSVRALSEPAFDANTGN